MGNERDLKRLLFNLEALVDLGQEVTSGRDAGETLKAALHVVSGMFAVPRSALFVHDPLRCDLAFLTGKGLETPEGIRLALPPRQMKFLPPNEPVDLRSVRQTPFCARNAGPLRRLEARTLVPLFARTEFVGLITLGRRLSRNSYLRSEKDVLRVAAHQLATALHNARLFAEHAKQAAENKRLYEDMRLIYHDTIQAFAAAIDAKDEYTKHHSRRVARYAAAMAHELGWRGEDVEAMYVAGLLHDIGKITIDRQVINKRGDLTPREQEELRRHPEISYDILTKIRFPWKHVAHVIRHHHERPDGRGYPDALTDGELSDGVKVLALADAFDAMTTDRPYRRRLSVTEAVREVERCIGTQFDRKISATFFRILEKDGDMKDVPVLVPEEIASSIPALLNITGMRIDA